MPVGQKENRSKELSELYARVSAWRKQEGGGGRGTRVPDELWQEAVRVARIDGLYRTAQALRFNYARLKELSGAPDQGKSVAAAAGGERAAQVEQGSPNKGALVVGASGPRRIDPVPVEVPGPARFVPLTLAPGRQTTVELLRANGDRMRVEVAGELDVVGLVQTFWGPLS
jgi:hypothetical protein